MYRLTFPIFLLVAFAIGSSPARADEKGDKLGEADKQFIREGLNGTQVQNSLSRLARSHSSNEHVKVFADESLSTLKIIESDLRSQADKYHMEVSAKANETQKGIDERLSKLKGAEFDEQFMKEQVGMLEWLVKVFDSEIKDGDNSSLKSLATHRVDDVRIRLSKAKDMYNDLYKDRKDRDK